MWYKIHLGEIGMFLVLITGLSIITRATGQDDDLVGPLLPSQPTTTSTDGTTPLPAFLGVQSVLEEAEKDLRRKGDGRKALEVLRDIEKRLREIRVLEEQLWERAELGDASSSTNGPLEQNEEVGERTDTNDSSDVGRSLRTGGQGYDEEQQETHNSRLNQKLIASRRKFCLIRVPKGRRETNY